MYIPGHTRTYPCPTAAQPVAPAAPVHIDMPEHCLASRDGQKGVSMEFPPNDREMADIGNQVSIWYMTLGEWDEMTLASLSLLQESQFESMTFNNIQWYETNLKQSSMDQNLDMDSMDSQKHTKKKQTKTSTSRIPAHVRPIWIDVLQRMHLPLGWKDGILSGCGGLSFSLQLFWGVKTKSEFFGSNFNNYIHCLFHTDIHTCK